MMQGFEKTYYERQKARARTVSDERIKKGIESCRNCLKTHRESVRFYKLYLKMYQEELDRRTQEREGDRIS